MLLVRIWPARVAWRPRARPSSPHSGVRWRTKASRFMCAPRVGDDQRVSYDDRISIPTPEGVELELVLAGLGSRLVATIVDFLIRIAVLFALLLVGGSVGGDE